MKQEHPGRETQESPGFSRGEKVNVSVNAGEFDATANWTVSGYAESHAPYPDPTVLQVELSRSVRDNRSDEVATLLAHAVCT